MAQNNLAIKIFNEALKAGSRCSRRSMHDGAASKKNLHNTESVLGLVADSMGRTRSKLSGTEDRNGMTRVGPNPDILQVSRAASEAVTGKESRVEDKNNYVSTDPNSSMWNMYKEKEPEGVAKKLTVRFRKMKDNIKQYYIDRLEENQVMFTEVDEPLTIPKFDKKERVPKYRVAEVREDDPECLDEMAMVKRQRRQQRLSLFNQLQSREQNKDGEAKLEELDCYNEVKIAEPQARGYKKFNKLDYKGTSKSAEEVHGRDIELRGGRVAMAKPSGKSIMAEDDQEPRTIWKKSLSSKGEKELIKERSDTGFSDVVGGMTPAVHFKTTLSQRPIGRGGLLDLIKSDELVNNAFRKSVNDPRHFSTMSRNNSRYSLSPSMTEAFERYKPVNIVLQRQIATQNKRLQSVAGNNWLMAHSLSTCSRFSQEDNGTRPSPLPPKECTYSNKLEKCPKIVDKDWPCCERICLCGCDAPNPRSYKVQSGITFVPLLAISKRPEYQCPSFSECSRIASLVKPKKAECCIAGKSCNRFVGTYENTSTAMERQEINLGQKYWTGQQQQQEQQQPPQKQPQQQQPPQKQPQQSQQKQQYHTSCLQQRRGLHTSRPVFAEGAEESCDKKNSGSLPCLKPSQIPGGRKKEKATKGSCDKLCMPCCEPARDPPECFSVYTKGPCEKFRNPRPSFSECRKKFPFKHTMCECEVPKKPLCKEKKKAEPTC